MPLGMGAGLSYLLLGNNRKVIVATRNVRQAALDAPPPTDGTARLIVVRQSPMGMLVGVDVAVDGVTVTQLKSPRFAILSIAPGVARSWLWRRGNLPDRRLSMCRRAIPRRYAWRRGSAA